MSGADQQNSTPEQSTESHLRRASADLPQTRNPPLLLNEGDVLSERYRIIKHLGQGGMGSVYLVEQIFLQKQFALKTLDATDVTSVAWRRFQKEADAASQLDHPGLVRVHDFGMLSDNQPYFVMDYCPGKTLADIIKQRGSLPLEKAVDLFIQICFALGHAHEKGIIHRDIKPSNIIVDETEGKQTARLVDFGIAKLSIASEEGMLPLTRTGEIFGTPFYMSPEQCRGLALDKRSDIYAVGCVLFEALSSVPPHFGDTALATMMKHQSETTPTLKEASLGKHFPAAIENIVATMLQKAPSLRYQDILDVANALASFNKRAETASTMGGIAIPNKETVSRFAPNAVQAVLIVLSMTASFVAGVFVENLRNNGERELVLKSHPSPKS
ncbi:MAG TPA: serine/threonine-protein kinase, partial [Chroococcales cyanobacterium]